VLLSLALGFAEQHGAQRLCLALNREDADSYPSGSPAFIDHFRKLTANLSEIAIEAPLIGLNKAETIQLGYKLGVNFAYTYSCLLGRQQPCGRCPQCLKRRKAFAIAGQPDPAMNLAGIRP
jgi:7-cyano-7-deazaguanine synthase